MTIRVMSVLLSAHRATSAEQESGTVLGVVSSRAISFKSV